MAKDYEVGYGKPPKHTRFKKGQSGNSKGRPKGQKNMRTIVNSVLDRTVTITENGQTRPVKFLEAFVNQMAAKALNGSTRDQIALLKAMHDYMPELLQEDDVTRRIVIVGVKPDGTRTDLYRNRDPSFDASDNHPKASPAEERPEPPSDEDDSWLD